MADCWLVKKEMIPWTSEINNSYSILYDPDVNEYMNV
jgi:hypothetical protein